MCHMNSFCFVIDIGMFNIHLDFIWFFLYRSVLGKKKKTKQYFLSFKPPTCNEQIPVIGWPKWNPVVHYVSIIWDSALFLSSCFNTTTANSFSAEYVCVFLVSSCVQAICALGGFLCTGAYWALYAELHSWKGHQTCVRLAEGRETSDQRLTSAPVTWPEGSDYL